MIDQNNSSRREELIEKSKVAFKYQTSNIRNISRVEWSAGRNTYYYQVFFDTKFGFNGEFFTRAPFFAQEYSPSLFSCDE